MANTQPALLNLVRTDTLATSEALDQESGATVYNQYDEVELTNPDGDPCVMLRGHEFIDQDYRHRYIGGGVGRTSRRARHHVELMVDYIGDGVRRKLERWKHERATCWLNPGWGRVGRDLLSNKYWVYLGRKMFMTSLIS